LSAIGELDPKALQCTLDIADSDSAARDGAWASALHVSDRIHGHVRGLGNRQLVYTYERSSRFKLVASDEHLGTIPNFMVARNIGCGYGYQRHQIGSNT
jgi:hypothetical protein